MTLPEAKILLVEDDPSLLSGISDLLEIAIDSYHVEVLQARNGVEGLSALSRKMPALIVSDIAMPAMDGYEFLRQVRQNPDWIHIPFIFLTAKGARADVQAGNESGAEQYIVKPFDPLKLARLVEAQLDRGQQLAQAREQQLGRLKHTIIQTLNHEFRTPLTLVTAYRDMLASSLTWGTDEPLQDYLFGIQAGCSRLNTLIGNLILLIDLRTGELRHRYESDARPLTNLKALWEKAAHRALKNSYIKTVRLHLDILATTPAAYGLETSIETIVEQLIDNAIKFTDLRGEGPGIVHVWSDFDEESVFLHIADSGIGIPEHALEQIFDLFFQLDRELLEQQGAGLGLTLAKDLASLNGGKITLKSEVGQGSTFTLALPRFEPDNEGGSTTLLLPRQSTILVVEDDPYLREGLCDLIELTDRPFNLTTIRAGDGMEALRIMADRKPDLIISDIMMPVMDGYTFLENVRQKREWVQIPFVFLTAKGEEADILVGRKMGVEEYITKPYSSEEIISRITVLLRRYYQVQDAVEQSFTSLKRSILRLLTPQVRDPLDRVSLYSAQLAQDLRSASSETELKSSLHGLRASSHHLFRVVEDFILLAEIQTGEAATMIDYQRKCVESPQHLLRNLLARNQPPAAAGIALKIAELPDLPPISVDQEALERILRRIVDVCTYVCQPSNSSTITVTCSSGDEQLRMSFRCHYAWFTDRERELVDAWKTSHNAALLSQLQYGSALAVVYSLIDLHHGHMEIDNDESTGCVLRIVLPACEIGEVVG